MTMNKLNVTVTGETSRNILIQLANSTNSKKVLVNKDWIESNTDSYIVFKNPLFFNTVLRAFN